MAGGYYDPVMGVLITQSILMRGFSLEMNVMRLWKKSGKYMAEIMKNRQAGR